LADPLNADLYVPEPALQAAEDLRLTHKANSVRAGKGREQIDEEGLVWIG